MGYRCYVGRIENELCFGKLYGYCDTYNLKSYKWLVERGYIDPITDKNGEEADFTFAECNGTPCVDLCKYELEEFLKLYIEDWEVFQMISSLSKT